MPTIRRLALLGLAAGLLMGCGPTVTETTKILRFTAIPDQTSTELQEKFQPLVEYLSQQLGISVEYVPARDYQGAVEMFKNADVMLAWFGGLTGVQARQGVPACGSAFSTYCNEYVCGGRPAGGYPSRVAQRTQVGVFPAS